MKNISENLNNELWWKGAVVYQIYLRSFLDSNGDGIGDLPGVKAKLQYVSNLGVDAIWLSPFYESPMFDYGYDIKNYRKVDPIFGDLQDFKELVSEAHGLGLKVIVDQVLSHTSREHPWFIESNKSKENKYANWYVWADPKDDGTPPNNWLSMFGEAAWTWSSNRSQYYLRKFFHCQPALNFHNQEVQQAQLENVEFWLQLGVDGIRLDVINFLFHRQDLKDNPPTGIEECNSIQASSHMPFSYQKHIYDISQPETIPFLNRLRALLDKYGAISIGEISAVEPIDVLTEYTEGSDRLNMAYTFSLLRKRKSPEYIKSVIEETKKKANDGWACWALSNHDVVRSVSRWGNGGRNDSLQKVLLAMMLSLKGSYCIYQGEELGLPDGIVPDELVTDPLANPFWPKYKGRDGCRTPMPWNNKENGGFTTGEPWLPLDTNHIDINVLTQSQTQKSCLRWFESFLNWRKAFKNIWVADLELLELHEKIVSWVRTDGEDKLLMVFNILPDTIVINMIPPIVKVLDGHGFQHHLNDTKVLTLPPYQAFYAHIR